MNALTGTGSLVRLILRRDRVLMPLWVLIMAMLPLSIASGTTSLYPTDEARQGYIDDLASSPLLLMFYGTKPAAASLGALVFWRMATGMILMAIIGLLVVIRHTRVEEEAGRRELLGSAVVGRHANLAAALIATSGASLTVGVLVALGMSSQDTPADGAFAMGLAWAAAGIVFAAIGAVVAQLTEGAGRARGIGMSIVGVAFALRAAADVSDGGLRWLSWLSPLGWSYNVHAYTENRWWVFGLAGACTLALGYLAIVLSGRRDLGAGLLPPQLGPAEAAPGLRSPLALAWRLHAGSLVAWTVAFALSGGLIGGIAKAAADLLADNEQLKQIMERMGGASAMSDIFLAGTMGLAATIVSGYAVSAALRMRTEEASLRSEPVLATGVGRSRWAASHLVFVLLGPAVAMAALGLVAGIVHGVNMGDVGREIPRVLAGALVFLPAVWLLAAVTVAMFGILPRLASSVGWAALGFCFLLGQVGALLQLSQSVLDISPFTHIPRVPGADVEPTPLLILTGLAAALIAAGFAALHRRDIPVT